MKLALGFVGISQAARAPRDLNIDDIVGIIDFPTIELPDGLVFPCKDICLGGDLKENLVDCGKCLYRNWKVIFSLLILAYIRFIQPCEDGIYPHEENCNQFYTCLNGKRLPDFTCPGSMLFNPETVIQPQPLTSSNPLSEHVCIPQRRRMPRPVSQVWLSQIVRRLQVRCTMPRVDSHYNNNNHDHHDYGTNFPGNWASGVWSRKVHHRMWLVWFQLQCGLSSANFYWGANNNDYW
jgi:hypothetical protein